MRIEIINHGVMYSDYFQGCGIAFTDYTHAATGIGSSEREAFDDALEQLAQQDGLEGVDWDAVEAMAIEQYGEPSSDYEESIGDFQCPEEASIHLSVRIALD